MKRPNQGNIRYFQKCDSHTKSYFLGFISADGCLQDNGSGSLGLSITISEKDRQILEKLKEEIGCENIVHQIRGRHSHNTSKEKYHCRFQLFNKLLYNDILSYGITQKKSTTMQNIIVNIPEQYRKSFIIGYFDGDGSVTNNIKRSQLMVSFRGTEAFLNGIANELSLSAKWIYKDSNKNCYSLVFWRKSDINSFFKIYDNLDFYLLRKYVRFSEFLKINKDETISSS